MASKENKRSTNLRESIILKVFILPIQWVKANRVMLLNAGSLVATTGVTSVLGFAYWWLAARRFSPEAVGIASTSTSAMMLIGGLCTLGFSTLLITELPRKPDLIGPLISTALLAVGAVAGVVSLVFAFIAPYLSSQYRPLRANGIDIVILVVGIALSAMTLVFDQAMIGLLRGELQFWRNLFFSAVKLLGLFLVAIWFSRQDGMGIYAAWAFASVLSLFVILLYASYKGVLPLKKLRPQPGLLKKLGFSAFQHHLLNTALQAPMQILPLLVTALLTAQVTAWFFTAWQLANFVFLIPSALTSVLHAMNSADPAMLARKARSTIGLATLVALFVDAVLLFETKLVLSPFGSSYAMQAAWTLRILCLASFPLIIKSHYISICRIHDRIKPALYSMAPGSLLEVVAAAVGAHVAGLTGLSLGWVLAVSVESLFMLPTVYKAVWPSRKALSTQVEHTTMEEQAVWLMDTIMMPALSGLAQPEQVYNGLESIWNTETITMPAINDMVKKSVADAHLQEVKQQTENSFSASEDAKDNGRQIRPKLSMPSFTGPSSHNRPTKLQRYKLVEDRQLYTPITPIPDINSHTIPTTDPVLQSQGLRKNILTEKHVLQYEDENNALDIEQIDTIKVNEIFKNKAQSTLE